MQFGVTPLWPSILQFIFPHIRNNYLLFFLYSSHTYLAGQCMTDYCIFSNTCLSTMLVAVFPVFTNYWDVCTVITLVLYCHSNYRNSMNEAEKTCCVPPQGMDHVNQELWYIKTNIELTHTSQSRNKKRKAMNQNFSFHVILLIAVICVCFSWETAAECQGMCKDYKKGQEVKLAKQN